MTAWLRQSSRAGGSWLVPPHPHPHRSLQRGLDGRPRNPGGWEVLNSGGCSQHTPCDRPRGGKLTLQSVPGSTRVNKGPGFCS